MISLLSQSAWVMATSPDASIRNGTQAVELAERAAQLSSDLDPSVLGTLASAYAEAGRYSEAQGTVHKALNLAEQEPNAQQLVDGLKSREALYKANTPFRDTQ